MLILPRRNSAFTTPAFTDPTSLGTKLKIWLDFTDTTTLWQNTTRTTQASTNGDPIQYVDDKSGNGNDYENSSSLLDVGDGGAVWNDGQLNPDASLVGLASSMEVYALIDKSTDTDWMLLGQLTGGSFFSGICQNGNTSSVDGGTSGTITHTVDNVDQSSPTRDTLHDAVVSAGPGYVTQGLRGIDLSGATTTLLPLKYGGAGFTFAGNCRHFILTTDLTTSERDDLHTWLDGEK